MLRITDHLSLFVFHLALILGSSLLSLKCCVVLSEVPPSSLPALPATGTMWLSSRIATASRSPYGPAHEASSDTFHRSQAPGPLVCDVPARPDCSSEGLLVSTTHKAERGDSENHAYHRRSAASCLCRSNRYKATRRPCFNLRL